jgi:hypothetical protein
MFSWDKIKRILDHYNINERDFIVNNMEQLEKSKLIVKKALKSSKFPDNAHPSGECFCTLANRLVNLLQNKNK